MSEKASIAPGPRTVLAHGKVNLFLAVGARRPDGFHDVVTILQALDLADTIEVLPSEAGTLVERDLDLGIAMTDDLVFRAAEAWRTVSGYHGGMQIRVTKRIPAGAGLGGGSADAAGVLAALSTWTGVEPESDSATVEAARSLGADVPFFLGPGTRLLTGRGDEPARVLPCPTLHLAVVNPGVPVPTGAVYAQLDRATTPPPPGPEAMVEALVQDAPRLIASRLYNNMTEAACALVPETRVALRFLENADGVLGSAMAGSGSSAFGIFDSEGSARSAAVSASERGWWSCATGTASRGVEVSWSHPSHDERLD